MTQKLDPAILRSFLTIVLLLAGAAWMSSAQPEEPLLFEEAELFFELNDTDGDLGIHGSIDGEEWVTLEIEGPGERRPMLTLTSRGRLSSQMMTQLAFESAEPAFDELAPTSFFRRFPEGTYDIDGVTEDGEEIEATATLSHVMAAPPQNVLLNRVPAAANCDSPLPTVLAPVLIDWDPVTQSHPRIGKPGPITISRYQLFVEREGVHLGLDLPPGATQFEVPASIAAPGQVLKFEIIARTSTGNNTAIESCFRVG